MKREVVPENNDGTPKQVSLQSLIGGLESSLLRSALSVSAITNSKDVVLPEVTPPTVEENHTQKKRHTEQTATTEANQKVTSTENPPEVKVLYLQTTEKVPLKDGLPAHILIDRVSVQDFSGDLPLILPFEVKHTKSVSATIQSGNPKEISITKTHSTSTSTLVGSSTENPAITTSSVRGSSTEHSTVAATGSSSTGSSSTTKANSESPSSLLATTETTNSIKGSSTERSTVAAAGSTSTTKSSSESSSSSQGTTEKPNSTTVSADNKSTTAETTSTTTTIKTPIVKLKEAEQELKEAEQDLKEKVAEIEADPVILSSRI